MLCPVVVIVMTTSAEHILSDHYIVNYPNWVKHIEDLRKASKKCYHKLSYHKLD